MEKTKNTTVPGPQNLMLENREKLLIQGVEQVESFDENCVQLDTTQGALVIRGRGLHIDRIDDVNKEVSVTGEIVAMLYDETRFKGGFLAHLMRCVPWLPPSC